jgi:peptide chain release factor 1
MSTSALIEKLDGVVRRHQDLLEQLSAAAGRPDQATYQRLAKARAELQPVVDLYGQYRRLRKEAEEARALLQETIDPELVALAQAEVDELEGKMAAAEGELQVMLLPKDPNDDKDIILEIRAGAGGDEATLFAGELLRMYKRYAENQKWRIEMLSLSETGLGGVKEAIVGIAGRGAYSRLKYESGVHRVQRVPATEASGRIHTSTVTVAVLPEAEEVEVEIQEKDLRIDVFRSSGPGGQSVNTTDSAVRVTHLPTGLVVSCQDEKSQHKNKAKALKVLRARLLDMEMKKQREAIASDRRNQVGTGERAEKIRTYNFRENRITDHRIGLTLHDLPAVLEGRLEKFIEALATNEQAERLKALA